jgi:hypothetical protein
VGDAILSLGDAREVGEQQAGEHGLKASVSIEQDGD